jgi:hypothetical protein
MVKRVIAERRRPDPFGLDQLIEGDGEFIPPVDL